LHAICYPSKYFDAGSKASICVSCGGSYIYRQDSNNTSL
jgi:hypothetical protein